MVCTANYEARKFGVRAAMPGFIARKLCPELVFVKPDFKKYCAAAEVARGAFAEVDADFVSRGLDEASLDATEYCAKTGQSPAEVRCPEEQESGAQRCIDTATPRHWTQPDGYSTACALMLAHMCASQHAIDNHRGLYCRWRRGYAAACSSARSSRARWASRPT